MSYRERILFLMGLDSSLVLVSIFCSLLIFDINLAVLLTPKPIILALILLISYHIFSIKFRLYHKAWEYASIGELKCIIKITCLSILITAIFQFIIFYTIYLRILIVMWMMQLLLIGGSRFVWRILRDSYISSMDKENGH